MNEIVQARSQSTTSRIRGYGALVALALLCGALLCRPALAQFSAEIIVGSPPPVMVQPMPAPRMGYVWAPGYWYWDGREYLWYEGHWELARAEEQFVAAAWVQMPMGWRFVPAHWERPERGHWEYREHERRSEFCPPGQGRHGRC